MSIIRKCKSSSRDKSQIGSYISVIQNLRGAFEEIRFSHIPRQAKNLDHVCALVSMKNQEEFYLVGDVPLFAKGVYEAEFALEPD